MFVVCHIDTCQLLQDHTLWQNMSLLASLMGQYCFARWRLSSSVMLPVGRLAARVVRQSDTPRRASTVTSR